MPSADGMEQSGDKTHEPTAHRRRQAREQGHVAHSQDLGSAALLIGGVLAVLALGGSMVGAMDQVTRQHLGQVWLSADNELIVACTRELIAMLARSLLPILAAMWFVAVAVSLVQVGPLFLPDKLAPDLSRINPQRGFSRLASLPSLVRLAFGMIKVALISALAWFCLAAHGEALLSLAALEPPQVAAYLSHVMLDTAWKVGAALLALALLDYLFQRRRHERDLRMTHQEIREEMKNMQGDPQIIARRRAIQRQLVLSRLSSMVPKADVVITNPTELAVAIEYKRESMAAPVVVAKGAGVLAQRIRRLALEQGIAIVEKKPLAQALYREVDVNQAIPNQMYSAVAEVLGYAYQLKEKTRPGMRGKA